MQESICRAIATRRIIEFTYGGERRRAEPFCYGTSMKGNHVLRAYQTWTAALPRAAPGWRLFSEDKISDLVVTGETFDEAVRSDYNRDDRQLATVVCAV